MKILKIRSLFMNLDGKRFTFRPTNSDKSRAKSDYRVEFYDKFSVRLDVQSESI